MKKTGLLKYIGRPYESYNCFDLVKEFYRDQFQIDISHFFPKTEVPEREECETLIASNKGYFYKIFEKSLIQFGDIVVIRFYGVECHIGVVINQKQFLHSARTIGSNMDRLDRYERMIAGFYRHGNLK